MKQYQGSSAMRLQKNPNDPIVPESSVAIAREALAGAAAGAVITSTVYQWD
jgi:hypothetical protein